MKQDLDISNIESKPTVVLVSNQSEYDQLMQHLEKEGKVWQFGIDKPTEWQPYKIKMPFAIVIRNKELSWMEAEKVDRTIHIPFSFPEYAAKHIQQTGNTGKFKRDRIRIERKKYDELVAERDRLKAEFEDVFQENSILKNDLHIAKESCIECRGELRLKSSNLNMLKTHARELRDQRDMARFIAALLLIVSVGFAVAVWIGKLIPVV